MQVCKVFIFKDFLFKLNKTACTVWDKHVKSTTKRLMSMTKPHKDMLPSKKKKEKSFQLILKTYVMLSGMWALIWQYL